MNEPNPTYHQKETSYRRTSCDFTHLHKDSAKTQDTTIKTVRYVKPWGHKVTLLHTTLCSVLYVIIFLLHAKLCNDNSFACE